MSILRVLLLAVLLVAATIFVGWVSVPIIAAVYSLLRRSESAPAEAAFAAILSWGALLARVAVNPAFSTLLARLGVLFQGIPGAAVAAIALVFGALSAWSAARVVAAIVVRRPAVER